MSEIVFFLEEPSAEALLKTLLPRLLPASKQCRFVVFEGKQDLDQQLTKRIRGYRTPGAQFVVLRDQDAEDCEDVKKNLKKKCEEGGRSNAVVRVACREIESWYLADLTAVERGLGLTGLIGRQQKVKYRDPDQVKAPSNVLKEIAPLYQKIGGSRLIGPHLDVNNIRSRSFMNFIKAVRGLSA